MACKTEDDRWDIIERLHAESPELWLDAGYGTAQGLQEYASGGFAEDYEFIVAVPGGIGSFRSCLKSRSNPSNAAERTSTSCWRVPVCV